MSNQTGGDKMSYESLLGKAQAADYADLVKAEKYDEKFDSDVVAFYAGSFIAGLALFAAGTVCGAFGFAWLTGVL